MSIEFCSPGAIYVAHHKGSTGARAALFGLVVLACYQNSQAFEAPYQVAWAQQIGTATNDRSQSIALDGLSNIYISGATEGDLGGPSFGGSDGFLTKFDNVGNAIWIRQVGTPSDDWAESIEVDHTGCAFITGRTYGNLGAPNAGATDAFVTKLDPTGNHLWTRQVGALGHDGANSVAIDSRGNALISGRTQGSLGGPHAGGSDAFLAKFDTAGNNIWTRQIGTASDDLSLEVTVDHLDNAFITGYTGGDLDGPNEGAGDVFLAKFDPAGTLLWIRQIGTTSEEWAFSVAVDGLGNSFICGFTDGDLGAPHLGRNDVFLAKFDASGDLLWTRQIGTIHLDWAQSVAVDQMGNALITGHTEANLGGPSFGSADAFVAKFDLDGVLMWVRQIGTSSADESFSIALDNRDGAFITGHTQGSLGGPHVGILNDAFLAKLMPEDCPADTNSTGAVDVDDLIFVILDWGPCPPPPAVCDADVNESGAVEVDDLIAVILNWDACP